MLLTENTVVKKINNSKIKIDYDINGNIFFTLSESRIRGSVALITFDQFHKHSSQIIQTAIFGKSKELKFNVNNLVCITNFFQIFFFIKLHANSNDCKLLYLKVYLSELFFKLKLFRQLYRFRIGNHQSRPKFFVAGRRMTFFI